MDTPRTVHVEHCMGTAFSIDIRDPGCWREAVAGAVALLHHADRVFSPYTVDSDLNRLRRNEIRLADADPDLAAVLARCAELTRTTGGWFSALRGGEIDPTGVVKGWAVERASDLLRQRGSRNHAVNGGGDIQLAGEAAPGQPWRIGISDPRDRNRLLATVCGTGTAIATSGSGERGQHIVDPFTGRPATALLAVTVTGPRLTEVDAYATAALAMGPAQAARWLATQPGYQALFVAPDGTRTATPGWAEIT